MNTVFKRGINSFNLIGEAKINDYTYKIDEKNTAGTWIHNLANLGIDCGEYGTIFCSMMGGYSANGAGVIYVHGKNEDGDDNFKDRFTVDWEDRFDEDILDTVGKLCFFTVGLEKQSDGKTYYKKFLTAYDAVNYIKEHLTDGTVVNVRGNLKYSIKDGKTIMNREINSIVLSSVKDKSKYRANFTQTILLTKDSVGEIDKEKSSIPILGYVVDYAKSYKDIEVKANIPFPKTFEFVVDLNDKERIKKIVAKLFKVKKGVTEITFDGKFLEGACVVDTTEDDLPDELKEMVELGLMSLKDALAKCVVSTNKEKRMILVKPYFKPVLKEGDTPTLMKIEEKYEEEDLIIDVKSAEIEMKKPVEEPKLDDDDDDDSDWLSELGI